MTRRAVLFAVALFIAPLVGWAQGAAGAPTAAPVPGVVGVTWALTTLQANEQAAESTTGSGLTITFGADGRVSGSGGCNQFSGTYTANLAGALTFSPLASTKIGCAAAVNDRETRYFATLQEVSGYTLDVGSSTLRLTFAQPGRQLVYQGAATAQSQVTGTVTYLQRIALPANAVVSVQLVNVSRQDAPAVVLAEQTGPTNGQSPPYPFTLQYDPMQIVANNTYAVQARITVDGQLRFISTQAYWVITQGRPTTNIEVVVDAVSGGSSPTPAANNGNPSTPPGSGGTTPTLPASGGGGMTARAATLPWAPLSLAISGGLAALALLVRRARRRVIA